MPEMGESVTEGTVLEWHVAEGDAVDEGDTIVEVSTDKVDAEVPAPSAARSPRSSSSRTRRSRSASRSAEMVKGAPAIDGAQHPRDRAQPHPAGEAEEWA